MPSNLLSLSLRCLFRSTHYNQINIVLKTRKHGDCHFTDTQKRKEKNRIESTAKNVLLDFIQRNKSTTRAWKEKRTKFRRGNLMCSHAWVNNIVCDLLCMIFVCVNTVYFKKWRTICHHIKNWFWKDDKILNFITHRKQIEGKSWILEIRKLNDSLEN